MTTRLNDPSVARARILAARSHSPRLIAKIYDVELAELMDAINGRTYEHMLDPAPVSAVLHGETSDIEPWQLTVAGGGLELTLDSRRVRTERRRLGMSQTRFAEAIRSAGTEIGEPNACDQALIQTWEDLDNAVRLPDLKLQRALVYVTGVGLSDLCTRPYARPEGEAEKRFGALQGALNESEQSRTRNEELRTESELQRADLETRLRESERIRVQLEQHQEEIRARVQNVRDRATHLANEAAKLQSELDGISNYANSETTPGRAQAN